MNRTKIRLLAGAAALACALGASSALAGVRVYVRVPPPAPIVEVRPPIPAPGHVWIEGYHTWNGNAYIWAPGHWEAPPRVRAVWIPGHWRHHVRHGYYWMPGHWR